MHYHLVGEYLVGTHCTGCLHIGIQLPLVAQSGLLIITERTAGTVFAVGCAVHTVTDTGSHAGSRHHINGYAHALPVV